MKLQQFFQRKWNYTILAFALPVIGILFVMLISGYAPFGNNAILMSDMYHQYYPFFVTFRNALRNGESVLYNWNIGLGLDYLGLISYYLASPLNLLSVFVPDGFVLEFFSLLMPVKLGFAGLFFAIFLKKTFQKDDFSITIFGCFYALCAWSLGYQWNIMWLDTFALLPLVALGTVSLLKQKKFVLYTITLFLSVFSNYYIGFFVCLFVFLLFFCYQICRWQGFRKFFSDLLRIALFSALAIGMTAILELPALAALQTTHSSVNKFPVGFQLNITNDDTFLGLLDAMRQVAGNMNGGIAPTFIDGLPNLYCGILCNIFAFLFLTCRNIKLRDKICSVFLLLLFNVSFIIRQLDYIWHGFHFTNQIPYRFSFLYSFVLLYMAYRAYLERHSFHVWKIILASLFAVGIAFCANDLSDFVYWAYNGVFLLLYISTLVYSQYRKPRPPRDQVEQIREYQEDRRNRRQIGGYILSCVAVLELALTLVNFGLNFSGASVSDYPRGKENTAAIIRYMKEREEDTLFFRAETTHTQTLNDGALNGYYGVSTFTSSANAKVTEFMRALGFSAKNSWNRYCFEEGSPVSNLFIGLKYMLERSNQVEENAYFDEIYQLGNVHLLENNAYLPLGFLANSQLVNITLPSSGNRFTFQNDLLSSATGLSDAVWTILAGDCLSITGNHDFLTSQSQTGRCSYDAANISDGKITFRYTIEHAGFFSFYLDQTKRNSFDVFKNGNLLYEESYNGLPELFAVCDVNTGDIIEIVLECKKDEAGTINLSAAILDEAAFRRSYAELAASTLTVTAFENTYVEGLIDCNRSGVLYTSIPQNGNWQATVDGQPAEIVLIGDVMVGVLLSEGQHTVCFTYKNGAFSLGWKISLACLAVFVILYFVIYQPKFRRKKGKYER